MGAVLDKDKQEPDSVDAAGLHEGPKSDVCGPELLQYLEISEANNGENPRILKVLSSLLYRSIEANEYELAKAESKDKAVTEGSKPGKPRDSCQSFARREVGWKNGRTCSRGKHCKEDVQLRLIRMFTGVTAPSIGLETYILRIHKYARCSPCCFVMAYAYMARLFRDFVQRLSPGAEKSSSELRRMPLLTSLNVHRLLITSILLAAKFMDDRHYNNAYYAKIGGISKMEINDLEMAFLKMVGYRLHVDQKEFDDLCLHLGRVASMQTSLSKQPTALMHPMQWCNVTNED